MLLVSIVGPNHFQVFGATWSGGRVCIDPLTEPLSLLYVPHRTDAIEKMSWALHAADISYSEIAVTVTTTFTSIIISISTTNYAFRRGC